MSATYIYELLCWPHTRPLVPANLSNSDDPNTQYGSGCTPDNIGRAIWPADYVHKEDHRLKYNQGGNT